MEQNNPVIQSPSDPVIQKPNNFLITLLSVLLLLSCIIAGFFAFQTQKLVAEVTGYREQLKQTPVPTPTPDPTADWKTYTNTKYAFSIQYPNNWIVSENPINDPKAAKNSIRLADSIGSVYISIFEEYGGACPSGYKKIMINSQPYDVCIAETTSNEKAWEQITFQQLKNTIELRGYAQKTTLGELLVPQILSTFKFTGSEPVESPVACTLEAKICPDGSSVGRSGPNCEFAPCPATSP